MDNARAIDAPSIPSAGIEISATPTLSVRGRRDVRAASNVSFKTIRIGLSAIANMLEVDARARMDSGRAPPSYRAPTSKVKAGLAVTTRAKAIGIEVIEMYRDAVCTEFFTASTPFTPCNLEKTGSKTDPRTEIRP
jgi:hypothetical protein